MWDSTMDSTMDHYRVKENTITVNSNTDDTYYAKFLRHEEKIRNLAASDPNSYAADVVKSMDHFLEARAILKKFLKAKRHNGCIFGVAHRILKEYSISTRASELFALWTVDMKSALQTMAKFVMEDEGDKISDIDRDARVCFGMWMTQGDKMEAIKFFDACRKKYPNEVFFHRIYCDLFLFTNDYETGLKASEEVSKLFPNSPNILHARAGLLRVTTDTGEPDYRNWTRQKKQVEIVKDAYKSYLKVTPKDHRQFAENNHVLAYLSLKYSTPSSRMNNTDMTEILMHYHNGINAEVDILPCFLPFRSQVKDFVSEIVVSHPPVCVYKEGNTLTLDMTTHGMPGRPKQGVRDTTNMTCKHVGEPLKRKIDLCVSHRRLLNNFFADPASSFPSQIEGEEYIDVTPNNNDSDDFEEIVLYQMTLSKKSELFTSKVIKLTIVEDSLYSLKSGFFEMVVADMTDDVIKLQLDLGASSRSSRTVKELMKKFRFGTVWSLRNPDFHMENGDENTMFIRARLEFFIPTNDNQDGRKCRNCFKLLTPGQNCSKCKRAGYCDKHCQTQDWKFLKHNLICSEEYNRYYK